MAHGSGGVQRIGPLSGIKEGWEKIQADGPAQLNYDIEKKAETDRIDERARNPRAILHRWHWENSDGRTGRGIDLSSGKYIPSARRERQEGPERAAEERENKIYKCSSQSPALDQSGPEYLLSRAVLSHILLSCCLVFPIAQYASIT